MPTRRWCKWVQCMGYWKSVFTHDHIRIVWIKGGSEEQCCLLFNFNESRINATPKFCSLNSLNGSDHFTYPALFFERIRRFGSFIANVDYPLCFLFCSSKAVYSLTLESQQPIAFSMPSLKWKAHANSIRW